MKLKCVVKNWDATSLVSCEDWMEACVQRARPSGLLSRLFQKFCPTHARGDY